MNALFKRHRVRATFYHIIALVFLFCAGLVEGGFIDERTGFWIGMFLFILDYIAEMYDPNPEHPGPWFKSHFHRFYDGDNNEEE